MIFNLLSLPFLQTFVYEYVIPLFDGTICLCLAGTCLAHKTAVASGALVMYLRYLVADDAQELFFPRPRSQRSANDTHQQPAANLAVGNQMAGLLGALQGSKLGLGQDSKLGAGQGSKLGVGQGSNLGAGLGSKLGAGQGSLSVGVKPGSQGQFPNINLNKAGDSNKVAGSKQLGGGQQLQERQQSDKMANVYHGTGSLQNPLPGADRQVSVQQVTTRSLNRAGKMGSNDAKVGELPNQEDREGADGNEDGDDDDDYDDDDDDDVDDVDDDALDNNFKENEDYDDNADADKKFVDNINNEDYDKVRANGINYQYDNDKVETVDKVNHEGVKIEDNDEDKNEDDYDKDEDDYDDGDDNNADDDEYNDGYDDNDRENVHPHLHARNIGQPGARDDGGMKGEAADLQDYDDDEEEDDGYQYDDDNVGGVQAGGGGQIGGGGQAGGAGQTGSGGREGQVGAPQPDSVAPSTVLLLSAVCITCVALLYRTLRRRRLRVRLGHKHFHV